MLFRKALGKNAFIPEGRDDEPRVWNCWITNFVKCPEEDKRWKQNLRSKQTEKILEASSGYLIEELRIIEPKFIVLVGGRTLSYYKKHIESEIDVIDILIRHYSRINSERGKQAFQRRIHKIQNLHDLIRSSQV
ncbi:MAG: uracil-DNA glycosylase [Candidatus Nitrosomirales archaeon]|jgi:uracil-DNA glycosylase